MRAFMRGIAALLAAALAGCTLPIETNPDTFNVEPAAVAHLGREKGLLVTNGYGTEAPRSLPMGQHTWVIEQRKLTDTAIAMLGRALEKHGVPTGPQSGKTVRLRVSSPSASMQVYIGFSNTYARVALEADFGDGTRTTVFGENRSPAGAPRAFDGAVLFALNKLLIDEKFVAYLNK